MRDINMTERRRAGMTWTRHFGQDALDSLAKTRGKGLGRAMIDIGVLVRKLIRFGAPKDSSQH